jgi:hypothetical protein
MGCDKVLHPGRYWSIGVEKDLKQISIRFETRKNFEHDQNVFSAVSLPQNPQESTRVMMRVEPGRY